MRGGRVRKKVLQSFWSISAKPTSKNSLGLGKSRGKEIGRRLFFQNGFSTSTNMTRRDFWRGELGQGGPSLLNHINTFKIYKTFIFFPLFLLLSLTELGSNAGGTRARSRQIRPGYKQIVKSNFLCLHSPFSPKRNIILGTFLPQVALCGETLFDGERELCKKSSFTFHCPPDWACALLFQRPAYFLLVYCSWNHSAQLFLSSFPSKKGERSCATIITHPARILFFLQQEHNHPPFLYSSLIIKFNNYGCDIFPSF